MKLLRITALAILLTGIILDHSSTTWGLTQNLVESNAYTFMQIRLGIWNLVDYLIIVLSLSVIPMAQEKLPRNLGVCILVFPATLGFLRILAGLSNLALLQ